MMPTAQHIQNYMNVLLEMDYAVIAGDLRVSDTEFSGKTINLYGLEVQGGLSLDNSIFTENNKVRFEGCSVGSAADFSEVLFESKEINFQNFQTGNGGADFENSQLKRNQLNFSGLTAIVSLKLN